MLSVSGISFFYKLYLAVGSCDVVSMAPRKLAGMWLLERVEVTASFKGKESVLEQRFG